MALVIAAVMVLGTVNFAFADDPVPAPQTISITNLEKDDSVQFYKILSWATDSATAEAKGAVSGWYWEEPFATAFDNNGDHGKAKLLAAIDENNNLMITDTLAGEIARALNHTTGKTPVVIGNPITVTTDGGSATHTFEAVAEGSTVNDGLYMAIITPAKQDTTYNPVFVHLDHDTKTDSHDAPETSEYWNNEGAAKKSTHTTTKTSSNATDYNGDEGDTAAVGDILSFTVTSDIPGYGDVFQDPFFNLTDTLKDLKPVVDDTHPFVVKVDGEEVAAGADTFSVSGNQTNSTTYTVEFKPAFLKDSNIARPLVITYFAKVTSEALANINKEKNTVQLEFSHDSTTEDGSHPGGYKKYEKDITNHYTFTIDANNLVGENDLIGESSTEIVKISVDKNGNPISKETKTESNVTPGKYQESPLAGAKFDLYKVTDNNWTKGEKIKQDLVSDANGRIKIDGLDEGKYVLVETSAPAGYVKNSNDLHIEIIANVTETEQITEYYDQAGNWYATEQAAKDAEKAVSGETDIDKKVGPYTYTTKELLGYTVNYNGTVSEYTFQHRMEGSDEIKWKISKSEEVPGSIRAVAK